jgi:cell division protein FtsN
VTTDLSQLHPEKDFSTPRPARNWLWIWAGAAALLTSGFVAFRAIPSLLSSPEDDRWLAAHVAEPSLNELARTSEAIFIEDSEQLDVEAAGPAPATEPALGAVDEVNELDEAAATAASPKQEATAAATAAPEEGSVQPASIGSYYVQLASYRTKAPADQHAAELAARGLPAQSAAYGGPEAGWWHAVRMGPFENRAAAEARRFELGIQDRQNAYVLPRSNGKFHVQVASFAEQEEAEQVAKRFTQEGHATKVTRVKMSGSYWHCVRIGPFDTREEAQEYRKLVKDVPGSESTVIPFGPPQKP